MTRSVAAVSCILLAGVLAVSSMQAQTKSTSGGTATGSTGNNNPELGSGSGKYSNFDQMVAHQHGSMSFMGTVVTANGQLPWDPIPVVVICNGKVGYNTETDLGGRFRIVAAPTQSEVSPQPGPKALSPAQLVGCNVHATLDGYKSTTLTIANRDLTDNSDIGKITLDIDERAKGYAMSPTTAAAPKDARKAFDKARAEAYDNHLDGAKKDLEKAVKADPQFAEAWYQLGKIEEAQQSADAFDAYSKAAAADPQFAPTYLHLALVAAQQKKWQETVDATDHALQLDPAGTPEIWYFSAVGNANLGHKDVAQKAAETSLAMDPSHVAPNTEQLLAVILASKGDYPGAAEHLQNSLTYTPPGPNADLMKQQLAQLQKIMAETKK